MHGLFLYCLQFVQNVLQGNGEGEKIRSLRYLVQNIIRLQIKNRITVLIQVEIFGREEK